MALPTQYNLFDTQKGDFVLNAAAIEAIMQGGTGADLAIASLNTVGAATIPAAKINASILKRGGTQTAAFTDTTDTADNIIAGFPGGTGIGYSFVYVVTNATGFPETLAGGTGVTVSGITKIGAQSWAAYLVTYTAADTLTVVGFQTGPLLAQQSTTQVVNAAGSASQSAATAINPALGREVIVATVSATSRGVRLPVATTGLRYEVFNQGDNPVNVFPATGAKIGSASTNAAVSVVNNKGGIFVAKDATHWALILGA